MVGPFSAAYLPICAHCSEVYIVVVLPSIGGQLIPVGIFYATLHFFICHAPSGLYSLAMWICSCAIPADHYQLLSCMQSSVKATLAYRFVQKKRRYPVKGFRNVVAHLYDSQMPPTYS